MRIALATLLLVARCAAAVEEDGFAGADAWLNTGRPLSLAELRGHVVLLDFWTYCCINCMQVMPDLKRLETRYADQAFVVVGVHSGKFDAEKDPEHIRAAVARHHLAHPVAVDSELAIWNRFAVHAWPTLVLLDVDGSVSLTLSGEGHYDDLERAIGTLIDRARAAGTLAAQPLRFAPAPPPIGRFAFPGKVLADAAGGRVFVADSGHHQVVECGPDGAERRRFGSGREALADGAIGDAAFVEPQGLALAGDGATLLVADRSAHALRAIALADGGVRTLAGDGEQGRARHVHGPASAIHLASPWDVAFVGEDALIAMAGLHQLWRYEVRTATMSDWAGTGTERCVDGPVAGAAFAQPSGLAVGDGRVYVADSETSSIRVIDLAAGTVATLAGSGDLFGFGADDGVGTAARFQHPLGIALGALDGAPTLFVADTFNQLVRTVDPATGEVRRFAGTGRSDPGADGPLDGIGFFEPGGLSVAGGTLWVADTNHHRLVAIDLAARTARAVGGAAP